jgi:hypothetical protein
MKWAYYLAHPVVSSIVFGLTMVILSFIDAKINGVDRTRNDYLKLFILVTCGTLGVLYVTSKRESFKQLGGHKLHNHHYHHSEGNHISRGFENVDVEVPDF